jgi:hypothetical protein
VFRFLRIFVFNNMFNSFLIFLTNVLQLYPYSNSSSSLLALIFFYQVFQFIESFFNSFQPLAIQQLFQHYPISKFFRKPSSIFICHLRCPFSFSNCSSRTSIFLKYHQHLLFVQYVLLLIISLDSNSSVGGSVCLISISNSSV